MTLNEKAERDISKTLNERAETNIKKIDWMELNEMLSALKEQIEYDINPDLEYWRIITGVDNGKAYIDIETKEEDTPLDDIYWDVESVVSTNDFSGYDNADELQEFKEKILAEKSKIVTKIIPEIARKWGFRNVKESCNEAVDDDYKNAFIAIRDLEQKLIDYKKHHRKRNILQINGDRDYAFKVTDGVTFKEALLKMFQNVMNLLDEEEKDCDNRIKSEVRIKKDNKNEKGETITEKQWNEVWELANAGKRPDRQHRAVAITLSDGEDKIFPNAASAIRALVIDRDGSLDDTQRDPTKDGDLLYDVCEGKKDRYGEQTYKGYPATFATRTQIEDEMARQGFTPKSVKESCDENLESDNPCYVIDAVEYNLFGKGIRCADLRLDCSSKMFDEDGNIKDTEYYDLSQVDVVPEGEDLVYYISLIDREDACRAEAVADKLGFKSYFARPQEHRPKDYYNYVVAVVAPTRAIDAPLDEYATVNNIDIY